MPFYNDIMTKDSKLSKKVKILASALIGSYAILTTYNFETLKNFEEKVGKVQVELATSSSFVEDIGQSWRNSNNLGQKLLAVPGTLAEIYLTPPREVARILYRKTRL